MIKIPSTTVGAPDDDIYTVISGRYANPEHTAAEVMTQEAASVLVSQQDHPRSWAALVASKMKLDAYKAPAAPKTRKKV